MSEISEWHDEQHIMNVKRHKKNLSSTTTTTNNTTTQGNNTHNTHNNNNHNHNHHHSSKKSSKTSKTKREKAKNHENLHNDDVIKINDDDDDDDNEENNSRGHKHKHRDRQKYNNNDLPPLATDALEASGSELEEVFEHDEDSRSRSRSPFKVDLHEKYSKTALNDDLSLLLSTAKKVNTTTTAITNTSNTTTTTTTTTTSSATSVSGANMELPSTSRGITNASTKSALVAAKIAQAAKKAKEFHKKKKRQQNDDGNSSSCSSSVVSTDSAERSRSPIGAATAEEQEEFERLGIGNHLPSTAEEEEVAAAVAAMTPDEMADLEMLLPFLDKYELIKYRRGIARAKALAARAAQQEKARRRTRARQIRQRQNKRDNKTQGAVESAQEAQDPTAQSAIVIDLDDEASNAENTPNVAPALVEPPIQQTIEKQRRGRKRSNSLKKKHAHEKPERKRGKHQSNEELAAQSAESVVEKEQQSTKEEPAKEIVEVPAAEIVCKNETPARADTVKRLPPKKAASVLANHESNEQAPNTEETASKSIEALDVETEQTLKDINRWLEHTPRINEFSSASSSPSRFNLLDEVDPAVANKLESSEFRRPNELENDLQDIAALPHNKKKATKDKANASETPLLIPPPVVHGPCLPLPKPKEPNTTQLLLNPPPPPHIKLQMAKEAKRKSLKEKLQAAISGPRRKELLRNFQIGKSKVNPKNIAVEEETPASKVKDLRKSMVADALPSDAPKLSLGTVIKTEDFPLSDLTCSAESDFNKNDTSSSRTADEKALDAGDNIASEDAEKQEEKEKPNLSAWFKAFGAPKKTKKPEDETRANQQPALSGDYNYDHGLTAHMSPLKSPSSCNISSNMAPIVSNITLPAAPRQRKASTGSTISERSSFSQDADSPRIAIDERYGSYNINKYSSPIDASPIGLSPIGASPIMVSPKPEDTGKPHSPYAPLNGPIKVGFYQDTTTKSSPEKSCSPCDISSPFPQYTQHLYSSASSPNVSNPEISGSSPYGGATTYNPSGSEASKTPVYTASSPLPHVYEQYKQPRSQESDYNSSMSPSTPNPHSPYQQQTHSPYPASQTQQSPYHAQSPYHQPQQQQAAATNYQPAALSPANYATHSPLQPQMSPLTTHADSPSSTTHPPTPLAHSPADLSSPYSPYSHASPVGGTAYGVQQKQQMDSTPQTGNNDTAETIIPSTYAEPEKYVATKKQQAVEQHYAHQAALAHELYMQQQQQQQIQQPQQQLSPLNVQQSGIGTPNLYDSLSQPQQHANKNWQHLQQNAYIPTADEHKEHNTVQQNIVTEQQQRTITTPTTTNNEYQQATNNAVNILPANTKPYAIDHQQQQPDQTPQQSDQTQQKHEHETLVRSKQQQLYDTFMNSMACGSKAYDMYSRAVALGFAQVESEQQQQQQQQQHKQQQQRKSPVIVSNLQHENSYNIQPSQQQSSSTSQQQQQTTTATNANNQRKSYNQTLQQQEPTPQQQLELPQSQQQQQHKSDLTPHHLSAHLYQKAPTILPPPPPTQTYNTPATSLLHPHHPVHAAHHHHHHHHASLTESLMGLTAAAAAAASYYDKGMPPAAHMYSSTATSMKPSQLYGGNDTTTQSMPMTAHHNNNVQQHLTAGVIDNVSGVAATTIAAATTTSNNATTASISKRERKKKSTTASTELKRLQLQQQAAVLQQKLQQQQLHNQQKQQIHQQQQQQQQAIIHYQQQQQTEHLPQQQQSQHHHHQQPQQQHRQSQQQQQQQQQPTQQQQHHQQQQQQPPLQYMPQLPSVAHQSSNVSAAHHLHSQALQQGFHLYAGLRTGGVTSPLSASTPVTPVADNAMSGINSLGSVTTASAADAVAAISLKTSVAAAAAASIVPGSAFNFAPTPSGLGLYGDQAAAVAASSFLDQLRDSTNAYYMPGAGTSATSSPIPPAHCNANPESAVDKNGANGAGNGYSFLPPHNSTRAPPYPFINSPAQLDANSQLYQQYLRRDDFHSRIIFNQSLFGGPTGAASGYAQAPPPPPASYRPSMLGMPKNFNINRQTWF